MSITRNDLDETGNKLLWVSWSRVLEFSKCEQKAKLHYEGKKSTLKEGRPFVAGICADRAMRRWLEQTTPHEDGQMAQYVVDTWDKFTRHSDEYVVTWSKKDPVADETNARDLAIEAVTALEPFLRARVLPFEFEPEWRFQVPLQLPWGEGYRTIILNGGADIIVRNPDTDEWFIYDLKCTRNEHYVEGPMVGQLTFYQIVANMLLGAEYDKTTTAFLTPACKTQYHSLDISVQDRQHMMSRIVRYSQAMWTDAEATCNTEFCWQCDVKQHCPLFSTVTNVDGNRKTVSLAETAKMRKSAKNEIG